MAQVKQVLKDTLTQSLHWFAETTQCASEDTHVYLSPSSIGPTPDTAAVAPEQRTDNHYMGCVMTMILIS